MPHKRNPIGCEQITGLARLVRANAMAALENVALWHERDISHSSVERVILPDSFIALDHMLRRFTRIAAGHGRLSRPHAREPRRSRGVVFSAPCCSSSRGAASRANRPTSGCSATPCARSTSSRTSRRCCSPIRTSTRVLTAPRSRRRSISTISLRNVDASSIRVVRCGLPPRGPDDAERRPAYGSDGVANESPSVRHVEAVGVRSPGADHRRRAALDGLREAVGDVRQGKYFELELDGAVADKARALASEVPDKLLANPVIESYRMLKSTISKSAAGR